MIGLPCHRNAHHHSQSFFGVRLIAIYCIYPSEISRLEINFSPHSSVYGFLDIWIAAARLQGSEEYVNDLQSSSFSFPPSDAACVCAFLVTHTLRGRSRLCASLRLLATRVQKFTLFPLGYCAAADADSLFFLSLSPLPFSPSLPRCLHY